MLHPPKPLAVIFPFEFTLAMRGFVLLNLSRRAWLVGIFFLLFTFLTVPLIVVVLPFLREMLYLFSLRDFGLVYDPRELPEIKCPSLLVAMDLYFPLDFFCATT